MEKIKGFFRLEYYDWRVRAIAIAALAAVAFTIIVYISGYGQDPATHFGAVFAGWVSGLALFVVAGVVVAIVSLVKPEDEFFDYRARVLFRHQTGGHIDYIVDRLRSDFEFYSEFTEMKLVIKEYDEQEKKFRIEQYTTIKVRAYIDDIRAPYNPEINLDDVTPAPAGKASNRITYVRVNGKQQGDSEDCGTRITRKINAMVEPGEVCEIKYGIEFWNKEEIEALEHIPIRYTQKLMLIIDNFVFPIRNIKLRFDKTPKHAEHELTMKHGSTIVSVEPKGIRPNERAYAIYLNLA